MASKFLIDDDDDIAILVKASPSAVTAQAVASAPSPVPPLEGGASTLDFTPKRARDEPPAAEGIRQSTTVSTKGGDGLAKMSLLAFGKAKASLVNTGGASQHTPKSQKLLKVESVPKQQQAASGLTPAASTQKKEGSAAATGAASTPSTPAATLPPPAAVVNTPSPAAAAAADLPNGQSVPPKKTQTSLLSFFSKMACPPKTSPSAQ